MKPEVEKALEHLYAAIEYGPTPCSECSESIALLREELERGEKEAGRLRGLVKQTEKERDKALYMKRLAEQHHANLTTERDDIKAELARREKEGK